MVLSKSPLNVIRNYAIDRLTNSGCILCIGVWFLFLFPHSKAYSQNIYDYEHSRRYSQYLFESKQYDLASEELERVLYYKPGDDSVKFQLIRSYLMGNQFSMVSKRMDSLFPDLRVMPRKYALEYSKALISLNSFNDAGEFIIQNRNLLDQDRLYLKFNSELLDFEWDKANITYNEMKSHKIELDGRYSEIITKISSARYKSPGLALGLSAVVPGMGKIYAKNWKDGLLSLVFVSATTLQAYRGYKQYGPESGFFIAYGSIAASFYLGNLYGSYKAANKFNDKVRKQIHSTIRAVFSDTL